MRVCVVNGCLGEGPWYAAAAAPPASERASTEHPSALRIHASPRDTIMVSWNTLLAVLPGLRARARP